VGDTSITVFHQTQYFIKVDVCRSISAPKRPLPYFQDMPGLRADDGSQVSGQSPPLGRPFSGHFHRSRQFRERQGWVDQGHRSKILRYSLVTSEFGQLTAVQRLRDPQRLSGLATRKTGQIPAIPRYTKPLIRGVPERG